MCVQVSYFSFLLYFKNIFRPIRRLMTWKWPDDFVFTFCHQNEWLCQPQTEDALVLAWLFIQVLWWWSGTGKGPQSPTLLHKQSEYFMQQAARKLNGFGSKVTTVYLLPPPFQLRWYMKEQRTFHLLSQTTTLTRPRRKDRCFWTCSWRLQMRKATRWVMRTFRRKWIPSCLRLVPINKTHKVYEAPPNHISYEKWTSRWTLGVNYSNESTVN